MRRMLRLRVVAPDDAVIDDDQLVFVALNSSVSDVVSMSDQVVSSAVISNECSQFGVFQGHLVHARAALLKWT